MILKIIISNWILDLVTGILQKLAWELGFGPNLGWELGFGTPLHDPLKSRNKKSIHVTTNLILNTVSYVCVNKSLFLFSSVQKAVQSGHSNASSTAAAGLQQKKWIIVNL